MKSPRYLALCLAFGITAVWAGENKFWFIPPADLSPLDLAITVIAHAIASGVGLSLVIWTGVAELAAAALGGAVMGYMAEGVMVGTIYSPLPFFWVWTPLAWHALISGGLVLGIGRAGRALGPGRMALIWAALGPRRGVLWAILAKRGHRSPAAGGILALYLVAFGGLVVLAHLAMDRIGHLPRPPDAALWIAPGFAVLVWVAQRVADLDPLQVILAVVLALLRWTMRRLGQRGARVTLGAPVPVWQHCLVPIAPLIAVGLAPLAWAQGWATLASNWVVAGITCLLSVVWLGRLARRAARRVGAPQSRSRSAASAAPRSIAPSYSARPEMTPAMTPVSRRASRSASDDTPPEAMTGIVTARASAAVAAMFGPAIAPSRSMSV